MNSKVGSSQRFKTNNVTGYEIRTVVNDDGEVWFVAKDVATALGYENTKEAIRRHCEGGTGCTTPSQTSGGMQNLRIINEPDVYALIFGSKLESAKKFKKWVTSEVLPSIRKTGSYIAPTVQKIEPVKMNISELNNQVRVVA